MSETYFNASEVLTIAMNIEEDGVAFYTEMSRRTNNDRVKQLFEQFAEEEESHKNSFDSSFAKIGEDLFDFETENMLTQYLSHIVDNPVFPKKADYPNLDGKGTLEAINMGIRAEKMSVEFYERAANSCVNEDGKKSFEKLREIEKDHVKYLETLKQNLMVTQKVIQTFCSDEKPKM